MAETNQNTVACSGQGPTQMAVCNPALGLAAIMNKFSARQGRTPSQPNKNAASGAEAAF
jgi:hypothetical protein